MKGRRNPFVAHEGILPLAAILIGVAVIWHYLGALAALLPGILLVYLFFIFRDPRREIPASPLGIVSPVDGKVVEVGLTDRSVLGTEAHKIVVEVDSFGTYTARCPVEGKIMDLHGDSKDVTQRTYSNGLWVRTDEGDDVVLQFHGNRFSLAPQAFMRYGERVGQGQRCAYLRLTRFAEIQFPINSRVKIEQGQRVVAGTDILGKLPHH